MSCILIELMRSARTIYKRFFIIIRIVLYSFSPRGVMMFGMVSQILCGNLTGVVSSYGLHVFFRCLSAVACCQMYTAGQMICMFDALSFR